MNTIRIPLVGRFHTLRLTASDCAFMLRVDRHRQGVVDYQCHSNRPEVIQAASAIEPNQLIGIIGTAPAGATERSGFHVERLELLGRTAVKQP